MSITCDVAVLGGGTGGYIAAIRAAQLGKEVVVVEQDKLGGTCLHKGCIPSKSLLRSAELFAQMKDSESYGIETQGVALAFPKVQARKAAVVEQLYKGVQYLMKKHKIKVIQGRGRIIGPSIFSPKSGALAVELADGEMETIVPTNLIIATGSRPRILPGMEPDGQYVLSSDEALEMSALPASILIVGGGVIGVEWASMLHDFGVQVTVVEAAPQLLPNEDQDVAKELKRLFERRGIKVLTGAKIKPDTLQKDNGAVTIQADMGGKEMELAAEKLLLSIGRQANVEGIGLENTDIAVKDGFIRVNEQMQTTEPHIYAIGDCIGGLQLAHAASHEGVTAAEHLAGEPSRVKSNALHTPRCVYTRPEAASVGMTEQNAKDKGFKVKVGKFPFSAIGKALVYGEKDGFVKMIADAETGDLLGVHMIGPHVTDLISEAALAQVLDATPWEIGHTVHAHPTLAEILGEAALAVDGLSLGM
ncbi:dihydrolipoamide dehydrogenase [Paenibacillus yonginensis]|uniref:Dihydrolipoyl dehydrogenase n=1 Tax=Paenibacillus yonginensis TaxID=1462996 RepID=A0A1B1N0G0_9BACL|nr:dihydrolipoyl dehydrogenase [Paenibacillus yonginensis]ANS74917.1 dihydrolipoamide dehydrogenase [Paenibacillus yonginensis]